MYLLDSIEMNKALSKKEILSLHLEVPQAEHKSL